MSQYNRVTFYVCSAIFLVNLFVSIKLYASERHDLQIYEPELVSPIEVQASISQRNGRTIAMAALQYDGMPLADGVTVRLDGVPVKRTGLDYFIADITDLFPYEKTLSFEFIGDTQLGTFYFTRQIDYSSHHPTSTISTFYSSELGFYPTQVFALSGEKNVPLILVKVFYQLVKVPGYGVRKFKIYQYNGDEVKKGDLIGIQSPRNPNFKVPKSDLASAALAISYLDKVNWYRLIDDIDKHKKNLAYKAVHNWGLLSWGKTLDIKSKVRAMKDGGTVYLALLNAVPSRGKLKLAQSH